MLGNVDIFNEYRKFSTELDSLQQKQRELVFESQCFCYTCFFW